MTTSKNNPSPSHPTIATTLQAPLVHRPHSRSALMPLNHKEISDLVAGATTEATSLVDYTATRQREAIVTSDGASGWLGLAG